MLTVKIIDRDGDEYIKADVKTVSFNSPRTNEVPSVFIWYKEEIPETILSGRIYVMNEYGKTVADYELFDPKPATE